MDFQRKNETGYSTLALLRHCVTADHFVDSKFLNPNYSEENLEDWIFELEFASAKSCLFKNARFATEAE